MLSPFGAMMKSVRRRTTLCVLGGILIWGCGTVDVLGLDEETKLGTLHTVGEDPSISVPGRGKVGETLSISVTTVNDAPGEICIYRLHETRIEIASRTVEVHPIDAGRRPASNEACVGYQLFEHLAELQPDAAGIWTEHVHGFVRRNGGASGVTPFGCSG
jgi:hypothetical protein